MLLTTEVLLLTASIDVQVTVEVSCGKQDLSEMLDTKEQLSISLKNGAKLASFVHQCLALGIRGSNGGCQDIICMKTMP